MLTAIIFIVSIIRSFFPPEKVKKILASKAEFVGNISGFLLGIVTPFCSCSAVPVFIGFLEAGVPLGVTLSFLIASPMINEVALVLLWGLFGAKIALIYIGTGLTVAIISGIILGRIPAVEKMVEDYVWELRMGETEYSAAFLAGPFPTGVFSYPGYSETGDALCHSGNRSRRGYSRICAHRFCGDLRRTG